MAGLVFAFEIDIVYARIPRIATLLSLAPGVTDVGDGRSWGLSSEVRLRFAYAGRRFIVWEPFGDSSRYWIGPEDDAAAHLDISDIERVLSDYRPSKIVEVLGDLVSLKFLRAFLKKS